MDILVAVWQITMVVCGLTGDTVDANGCAQMTDPGYFVSRESCQTMYTFKVQEAVNFGWVKSGDCEKAWVKIDAGNWYRINPDSQ